MYWKRSCSWLRLTRRDLENTWRIEKMTNDPFGFNKAINYDKLNDPEVLKELEKIFIKDAPLEERRSFVKKIEKESE